MMRGRARLHDVRLSATALCATAWLRGHEFCVLSSVLEFWLMVYGFVFEKLPFGGGNMESPVTPWSPRWFGLTPHRTSKNQYFRSLDL